MERLAAAVLEAVVDHHDRLGEQPASRVLSRREADVLFDEPMPRGGVDPVSLVEKLRRDAFANISHVDHPRFFAFVPGPGSFVGAMAQALASGHNVFSGTWLGGSAAARIELQVIRWLLQATGLPAEGGGLFVSGGSMANLTALAAARHARLGGHDRRGVVYFSSQTHSAVERALRILGFGAEHMRRVAADAATGIDPAALLGAIRLDRERGRTPFCVVATAGTTNTGAVDPLEPIAGVCRDEGLWMHVDGAYGAAAVLGSRASVELAGLQLADSIALDPHKWMFQPFECGCLLVRDAALLREAYAIHPDYMRDTLREDEEINFCEYGVQLSRSFRALSLWLTLKTFGADAVGAAVDHAFELADHAASRIQRMAGWELVTPPSLAILTFRCTRGPEGDRDALNEKLVRLLRESGTAMLSSTMLDGRFVLRLCPINPRTTTADVDRTLEKLEELALAAG